MGIFSKFAESYRNFLGFYEQPYQKSYADTINDLELNQMHSMDLRKSEPKREQKAILENPIGTLEAMGYKDRPFSLSYDILRKMSTKDAVIGAIIQTRINQVSSFSSPARFSADGVGFEISLRDPEEEPTEEDKQMFVAIESFLENTGYDKDNSRDSFDTFLRKIVRDRLVFDQAVFEVVPDIKGRPAEFYAIDGATIRLASESLKEDTKDYGNYKELEIERGEEIKYVQIVNGEIQAYFTANELAFCVANPRTDIRMYGYGFSELEMLVHQVTSHLWAEEYNSKFFSQGGTTKGILNFKTSNGVQVDSEQLEAFKRQWLSQVSGMTGAWKTPVVSAEGLEYINVSQSNREMEFEKWLNYLINICCSVYQIDPSEVNFPNRGGATGMGGGGLGDGGIEERIEQSKDKGLRPLLRFIESIINRNLISRFSNRYVFSFVGLNQKSEAQKAEQRSKDVSTYRTIDELRKEEGLEPLPDGQGEIILNPSFIQYINQKAQAEQQKEMMAQGGGMMGGMPGMDSGEDEGEEDEGGGQGVEDEDYDYGDGDDDAEGGADEPEQTKSKNDDQEKDDDDEDEEDKKNANKAMKFITIELD